MAENLELSYLRSILNMSTYTGAVVIVSDTNDS